MRATKILFFLTISMATLSLFAGQPKTTPSDTGPNVGPNAGPTTRPNGGPNGGPNRGSPYTGPNAGPNGGQSTKPNTNNGTTAGRKQCATRDACLNDPNCLCWCSQLCGWRKKIAGEDHPVYIANDKYGKFCYCKQWDYDNYEANCIQGKNIKQPPGSR